MATTEDRGSLNATQAWREELYGRTPERQGELFSTISKVKSPCDKRFLLSSHSG